MTFLLELSNFKSFEKYILKIPSNGLVLLDGVSGSGKTSVIQSIIFAITGQGKKITSYGSKKLKVYLKKINENNEEEFSIMRTKGPDALILTVKDKEYHDDEAQIMIEKEFGKHFMSSSVLLQKGTMSFLSLSPKERLSQIENILFTDFNVEDKKQKIKKAVKENEDKILELSSKIDTLQSVKKLKTERLPNDKLSHLVTIDKCLDYKDHITQTYNTNITNLNSLKEKMTDIQKQINENNMNKERREIILKNLAQEKKSYEYYFDEYNKLNSNGNCDTINSKIKLLENKLKYIQLYNEIEKETEVLNKDKDALIKNIIDDIDKLQFNEEKLSEIYNTIITQEKDIEKLSTVVSTKMRWETIKTKITERRNYIDQINSEELITLVKEQEQKISSLFRDKKEAELAKTSIKCPCCSSMLRYIASSHTLEKFESAFYNMDISQLEQEIQSVKKSLEENKKKIENYKKISDSIENLERDKESLEKDIPDTYKHVSSAELNEKIQLLKTQLEDLKFNKNKLICNKNRISQLEEYKKDIEDYNHSILASRKDKIKSLSSNMTSIKRNIQSNKEVDCNNLHSLNTLEIEKMNDELFSLKANMENELQIQKQKNHYLDLFTTHSKKVKSYEDSLDCIPAITLEKEMGLKEDADNACKEVELLSKAIEEINLIENINNIDMQIQYIKYVEELNELEEKIITHKIDKDNTAVFTQKLRNLQSSIEIAESKLLYKFVDNLNQRVNYHLESMFADPLNVNVSCFKETKKGEKPKIDLEIFYKGNETEIVNLSGGEFDRLNMCFLLSFNELSRSSIIILDEALSSLNQELVCDIIEHLKENMRKDKLVIMTLHQSIKGMFDQVINL